jgi:alcohol dehydrogenase class IV
MQIFLNKLEELRLILNNYNYKCILLITGNKSYVSSGAKVILDRLLQDYKTIHFNQITPNPSLPEVEKACKIFRLNECDLIIAVGGGSVIDAAKATRILAFQDNISETVRKNNAPNKLAGNLIAIPTTAGSGAESTQFAVIYIGKKKYSLSHTQALPDAVVLDPRLTYNLPPEITASSGMDALAQAIESWWSVNSTEHSRKYSREALKKILPNFEKAVANPNPAARLGMHEGANLAGRAINIAKTTAAHAMSYGFSAYYNIPHGQAVSFTLPQLILFNSKLTDKDCQDPRGANFVRDRISEILQMLEVNTAEAAMTKLEKLIIKINLQNASNNYRIDLLLKSIDKNRLQNNPRRISNTQAQELIKAAI